MIWKIHAVRVPWLCIQIYWFSVSQHERSTRGATTTQGGRGYISLPLNDSQFYAMPFHKKPLNGDFLIPDFQGIDSRPSKHQLSPSSLLSRIRTQINERKKKRYGTLPAWIFYGVWVSFVLPNSPLGTVKKQTRDNWKKTAFKKHGNDDADGEDAKGTNYWVDSVHVPVIFTTTYTPCMVPEYLME